MLVDVRPYSNTIAGIILCMRPANERRCHNVTLFLIGWAHMGQVTEVRMSSYHSKTRPDNKTTTLSWPEPYTKWSLHKNQWILWIVPYCYPCWVNVQTDPQRKHWAVDWDLTPCPKLTPWGRDKMAAIFQTTFSNAFSWRKKMYKIWLISKIRVIHWSLLPRVQLAIFQYWLR